MQTGETNWLLVVQTEEGHSLRVQTAQSLWRESLTRHRTNGRVNHCESCFSCHQSLQKPWLQVRTGSLETSGQQRSSSDLEAIKSEWSWKHSRQEIESVMNPPLPYRHDWRWLLNQTYLQQVEAAVTHSQEVGCLVSNWIWSSLPQSVSLGQREVHQVTKRHNWLIQVCPTLAVTIRQFKNIWINQFVQRQEVKELA